jgi:hypothetical protein
MGMPTPTQQPSDTGADAAPPTEPTASSWSYTKPCSYRSQFIAQTTAAQEIGSDLFIALVSLIRLQYLQCRVPFADFFWV